MHKALLLLSQIPRGKVVTYKELARVCRTSPRGIGRIMARNRDPIRYPCYKVIATSGKLCGYSAKGGLSRKQKLLAYEGVIIKNGRVDPAHFYTFQIESGATTSSPEF